MKMLVYAFQHNVTKRIYVGCTGNTGRIRAHFSKAKNLKHHVPLVNSDCENYGFNFTAYALEIISCERANETYDAEKKWMHYFNTGDPECGYNYLDKKAQKRSIDSFPIYDEVEWKRQKVGITRITRVEIMSSIMKEIMERKRTGIGLQSLSDKSGISIKRLEEIFNDNRKGKQLEIISLCEALGIKLQP